jgi:hypothetical protein
VSNQDPNVSVPPRPPIGVPPPGSSGGQPAGQSTASGESRGRGRVLPLVASIGALVVALTALLVAWRALDQAHVARDLALVGRGQPGRGQQVAPQPTAGTPDSGSGASTSAPATPVDPTATGDPPPLTQRTAYKVKYDKQTLTLRAQRSSVMYVDLDEPRANVSSNGFDIELSPNYSSGTPYFLLGQDVMASDAGAPGMTPQDCANKIPPSPGRRGCADPGTSGQRPVHRDVVPGGPG